MYTCKLLCLLEFRLLRYCSSTGRRRRSRRSRRRREEHGNSVKIEFTCITPVLQAFLDFFQDIISFEHVLHLGVGRSQIEWKLKVKTEISVFPWVNIGQNDHSNPYIESTTVLSDRAKTTIAVSIIESTSYSPIPIIVYLTVLL